MADEGSPHVRRKRYRGTHPRHFSEKYKEHNYQDFPEDLAKVLARGATPAGSHRPICMAEILAVLAPVPGETAVDATLGHGGHASALLRAIAPGGRLIGFDQDAVELARTSARIVKALADEPGGLGSFMPVHADFSRMRECLDLQGIAGADLILADIGLSSMQIDDPERGFSFKRNGRLDMRMDRDSGPSAAQWLAAVSEESLAVAISTNADEEAAVAIARAICQRRGLLATTRDLAEAIVSAFPGATFRDTAMKKVLMRSFQAIRIEVNGEFAALDSLLATLPSCLNPGGRVAILTFHSGEERRVEASFAAGLEAGLYASIASLAIRPGREERNANPRSASARLRWAIAA
jgi:16S rRNA (cytosine1402-N4)-methyltransferase